MSLPLPVTSLHGDVTGIVFAGESEAVLFIPNSGDVLLSSRAEWEQFGAPILPDDVAEIERVGTHAGEPRDLRATLLHLGLKID